MERDEEQDRQGPSDATQAELDESQTTAERRDKRDKDGVGKTTTMNTINVPCHHIRLGDYIILQDRPCQVLKIETSSKTGQYRYLGVDLLTRRLYRDMSSISNPSPDVYYQSMPGPVFKQYRLRALQDGTATATAANGEVKEEILILETSNLAGRLASALDSSHDHVTIIVIEYGDIQLAVGMKFKPPSGEDGVDAIINESLQAAARDTQDSPALDKLLKDVEAGTIDINSLNDKGETVLDVTVSNPILYDRTFRMLRCGASPTAHVDKRTIDCLDAAANGDIKELQNLQASYLNSLPLGNRHAASLFNRSDRLGYTPLHEAVCFGHYKTVKYLIANGANVGRVILHGGDTALHMAIERGLKHRQYLGDIRARLPRLSEGHLMVIDLLLQKGCDVTSRRESDNLTAREVISHELDEPERYQPEELCYLERILILLRKPVNEEETQVSPPVAGTELRCTLVAHIQFRNSNRGLKELSLFVTDFIHTGSEDAKSKFRTEWALSHDVRAKEHWKWIHLPANVKDWVEHLIYSGGISESVELSEYRKAARTLVHSSFHEVGGSEPESKSRKPCFHPFPGSNGRIFSLVIPYLDAECLECFHGTVCSGCQTRVQNARALKDHFRRSNTIPSSIHTPRSLDQSYNLDRTPSKSLDEDQVVVKHFVRKRRTSNDERQAQARPTTAVQTEEAPPEKKLLMVKQMWIWKIDHETLITAFPDRLHTDKPELLGKISEVINGSTPLNLNAMVSRMLTSLPKFVDGPIYAGLSESLFDIFEQTIARLATEDYNHYKDFRASQDMIDKLRSSKRSSMIRDGEVYRLEVLESDMCSITRESAYLIETKDVMNELRMIRRVVEDQVLAVKAYAEHQDYDAVNEDDEIEMHIRREERNELENTVKDIELQIMKIQDLLERASAVEESFKSLLDQKQKQGSLMAARDTRRLAIDAKERAQQGEQQSQLLFIFTVVTVIFTPISFTASFMAIPTTEFPHAGDEVSWRWWQIFVAGLVAEFFTITLVATWLLPKLEDGRIRSWVGWLTRSKRRGGRLRGTAQV